MDISDEFTITDLFMYWRELSVQFCFLCFAVCAAAAGGSVRMTASGGVWIVPIQELDL
jgi:hypothetical protein